MDQIIKKFEVSIWIDGVCYGKASGKSKKLAQQAVAKIAIDKLREEDTHIWIHLVIDLDSQHLGESHGKTLGCIVDGVPAGIKIDEEFIQSEMDRRKPGQNKYATAKKRRWCCRNFIRCIWRNNYWNSNFNGNFNENQKVVIIQM